MYKSSFLCPKEGASRKSSSFLMEQIRQMCQPERNDVVVDGILYYSGALDFSNGQLVNKILNVTQVTMARWRYDTLFYRSYYHIHTSHIKQLNQLNIFKRVAIMISSTYEGFHYNILFNITNS